MATTLKKPELIREVLTQACEHREMLILATPFLRFSSNFIALEGDVIHVRATMSREDALYALRGSDLMMRFPNGLGFYEAPVQAVGIGLREGQHSVRLSIPKTLNENDQRVAYRVERVGRVSATFSTPQHAIHVGSLADLSVTGARVHVQRDIKPEDLSVGDLIHLDIPLPEIPIQTRAIVRHVQVRQLGLEFKPALPLDVEQPLSRWIFAKREEERERAAQRLEQSPAIEIRSASRLPQMGILLVTSDDALEAALRGSLEGLPDLIRLNPTLQALKEGLAAHPVLAIFHLPSLSLDERRRAKALTEAARRFCPTLLLGTNVDGAELFELAHEWKASSALAWAPERSLFLHRLAHGIIRRHAAGGESPMAPQEPA
ncbi:MAG TPA: PilZ domain-containing protein [Holophaga sp.]|nr:PilZ domain-containing protein [Holophaga sp.]